MNIYNKAYIFICSKNIVSCPAKQKLQHMLEEEELKEATLLILANKQDLANALPINELTQILQLNKLKNRKWHIQTTSVLNGNRLYQGFDWLEQNI